MVTIMIRKIFKQIKSESPKVGEDELQQIYEDIKSIQENVTEKKVAFKQEFLNGARNTKHKFTI